MVIMSDRPPPFIRIITRVIEAPVYLAAVMLFFLMGMTFFDVVLRSAFDNPIESATELTRLSMAIMVFSAMPLVSWKGQHILVDLMDPLFSAKIARIRDIIIDLACGVFILWPAQRVWVLAERSRDFGDVTEYLGLPQYLIGWFIAAFAMFTAVTFIFRGGVRIFAPQYIPQKESELSS